MKRILIALTALVITGVIALLLLLNTRAGLLLGYELAKNYIPGELSITRLHGSLLGPIQFEDVRYQYQQNDIQLAALTIDWHWQALLQRQIEITSINLSQLELDLPVSANETEQPALLPSSSVIPSSLSIHNIQLDEARIRQGNDHILLRQTQLQLQHRQLSLNSDLTYQPQTDDALAANIGLTVQPDDNGWRLADTTIRLPDNGQLQGKGTIGQHTALDLQLDWQQLHWPLTATEQPELTLPAGKARLTGSLSQFDFNVTTAFNSSLLAGELQANGAYQPQRLMLSELLVEMLDGRLQGNVDVTLSPELAWQAQLNFSHINPARLTLDAASAWPGDLSARLAVNGQLQDNQISQQLELKQLNGALRGYPLTASGKLTHRDQQLSVQQFNLHSADTHIQLAGTLDQQWQTQWSITSPDLSQLWPNAGGSLDARGTLSGPRELPHIKAQLQGNNVSLDDYSARSLTANASIDTRPAGQWQVSLQATQPTAADLQLASAELSVTGTADNHTARLITRHSAFSTELELQGALVNQQWQGQLLQADVTHNNLGVWRLDSRTPSIEIAAENINLPQTCLQQQAAELCIEFRQTAASGWRTRFSGDQLPLQLAQPWLPTAIRPDGQASFNGFANSATGSNAPANGQLQLTLTPGTILFRDEEDEAIPYQHGELNADLQGGALRTEFNLALNDINSIKGQLATRQWQDPTSRLTGRLSGSLEQLTLVEAFIPQIDQFRGTLAANIRVTGTIAHPGAKGSLTLRQGSFVIPRTAVRYQDVDLTLSSASTGSLRLTGQAHSDDNGMLSLKGKLQFPEQDLWQLQLDASGQQFLISDTLEARLRVSPKLNIRAQPYEVYLNGELHIPQARLRPKDYQGAVTPSRDTEILGQTSQAQESRWNIYTDVTISLGDNVNFKGYGLQGFIGGSLQVQDEPGQLTRGTGELAIREGQYRAYGQDLQIETGRLLFNNSPLDAPALDVRATRSVGNIKAGIQLDGPMQAPRVELYSEPRLSDSDTLSYLLFGRPLNQTSSAEEATMAQAASAIGLSGGGLFAAQIGEQLGLDEVSVESGETLEQTALQLGKYLSPSLYLGYSVGLFEPLNTLLLRYQINDNWTLETETGTESGADILFTIDR